MAMEVIYPSQPKRMHYHSMPIIIVAVAMLVVSIAYLSPQYRGNSVIHGLFTRTLRVTPAANGLAHISLNKEQPVGSSVSQSGRTVQLIFNLKQP